MLLIGLSRVYFAVHSPSQVVSGWLIGVLVVWLVVRFEPLFSRWFCAIGLCRQLVLALLTTTLLFSFQQSVISRWAAEFQVPEVWDQRYLEASENLALFKGESLKSESFDSQAGLVLFKAFDHTQTGVFPGVWPLAICIAKYGGFSPGSVRESGLIALFSLILIGVSLPVLTNLQGIGLLEIFVWSAVPGIIGLGLPRLLQKLLKL